MPYQSHHKILHLIHANPSLPLRVAVRSLGEIPLAPDHPKLHLILSLKSAERSFETMDCEDEPKPHQPKARVHLIPSK